MAISRVEEAQNDVVTAFQAITTGNGYRSTVGEVNTYWQDLQADALDKPIVSVLLYDETMKPVNEATWNAIDSTVMVEVVGQVLSTEAEGLVHDFKRVLVAMTIAHLSGSDRWWIDPATQPKIFRSPLALQADGSPVKCWVTAQFRVLVFSQDTNL